MPFGKNVLVISFRQVCPEHFAPLVEVRSVLWSLNSEDMDKLLKWLIFLGLILIYLTLCLNVLC